MYEAGELCDGTVKLGERGYPVSRMAMAAASPFFKAAFTGAVLLHRTAPHRTPPGAARARDLAFDRVQVRCAKGLRKKWS